MVTSYMPQSHVGSRCMITNMTGVYNTEFKYPTKPTYSCRMTMESEVHIDGHKVQNLLILTEKGF